MRNIAVEQPGEGPMPVAGEGFLTVTTSPPMLVRVDRSLPAAKNKYIPRSRSLLCGCQSSDLPLNTNGKSGLRTAAFADGAELHGDTWRKPRSAGSKMGWGPRSWLHRCRA